jgi:hypothetical protein
MLIRAETPALPHPGHCGLHSAIPKSARGRHRPVSAATADAVAGGPKADHGERMAVRTRTALPPGTDGRADFQRRHAPDHEDSLLGSYIVTKLRPSTFLNRVERRHRNGLRGFPAGRHGGREGGVESGV